MGTEASQSRGWNDRLRTTARITVLGNPQEHQFDHRDYCPRDVPGPITCMRTQDGVCILSFASVSVILCFSFESETRFASAAISVPSAAEDVAWHGSYEL
jgi:hypothetical protein